MVEKKKVYNSAKDTFEEQVPSEGDDPKLEETDAIATLVAQVSAVAEAEKIDQKAVEKLGGQIEKLSSAAQKVLMDSPLMQSLLEKVAESTEEDRTPGEVVKVGAISYKIPWKARDLEKFPKVTYAPNQREEYTWNGIAFVFEADETYQVPEPVMELIMDKRGDAKRAREEVSRGLGRTGVKQLAAPGWAGKIAEDAKGGV